MRLEILLFTVYSSSIPRRFCSFSLESLETNVEEWIIQTNANCNLGFMDRGDLQLGKSRIRILFRSNVQPYQYLYDLIMREIQSEDGSFFLVGISSLVSFILLPSATTKKNSFFNIITVG